MGWEEEWSDRDDQQGKKEPRKHMTTHTISYHENTSHVCKHQYHSIILLMLHIIFCQSICCIYLSFVRNSTLCHCTFSLQTSVCMYGKGSEYTCAGVIIYPISSFYCVFLCYKNCFYQKVIKTLVSKVPPAVCLTNAHSIVSWGWMLWWSCIYVTQDVIQIHAAI